MPLDSRTVTWVLRIGSCAFWLLIGVRMAASRTSAPAPDPGEDRSEAITSRRASAIFWLSCLAMAANSGLLALWSMNPRLTGPALLPRSLTLQRLGIGLMAGGLGLMAWAYLVFRSFRLMPKIEAGHELCEDGPFAWLRHPIYGGINLFYLATFFLVPRLLVLLQVLASIVAFDLRARAEEQLLTRAFGEQYRRYMERTRRFLPALY